MQAIAPVTADQLLAPGQIPKAKLEIYNNASWINLCNLFSPIGLVGWWAFDEGAGMVAYDHSKNKNHGSLENMTEADWVDGKVGKCLDFDGVDDNVLTDNSMLLPNTSTYTAWFKADSFVDWGAVVSNLKYGAPASGFNIIPYSGKIRVCAGNGTDGYTSHYFTVSGLTTGTWYHVAVTYDGTKFRCYLNGVYRGEWTYALSQISQKFIFGRWDIGYDGYYFDGLIDEVRIYNRVLTQGEIKALAALKGKNYVEGVSVSLGGASMTPNPVGGTVNAALLNKDSVFHPNHPTSAYKDWLKTGRKIRASIGATYNDIDYFWQRVIGVMGEPKFTAPDYKVSIGGGDYMKFLQDAQLRIPNNYWGAYQTFDSFPSDGLVGDELYNEVDAMDINNEANNVTNWTPTDCTFVSLADVGGGSEYVGRLTTTGVINNKIMNTNVGNATAGNQYRFRFKHRHVGSDGSNGIIVQVYQASGRCKHMTFYPTDDWSTEDVYFTALDTGAIEIRIWGPYAVCDYRVDQFSIFEFIPYWNRYYQLPVASKGPYYVTLDKGEGAGAEPVWEGTGDEDWEYDEDAEPGPPPPDAPPAHPARIVYFNTNKKVPKGTDNLVIHYFTTEAPENAVARILYFAGLYASEAAALADMEYTATGITIDRIWFKPGSKLLDAIKKLCERCDYRFHFEWNGTPVFKAKATYSDALTDGGLNIWASATNLTNWTEYKEGTSTINREATEKVEGDYSCRFDVDASNSQVQIYQMNISLTPLKRRKVIIWYKNSVAGKTFQFYIRNIGNNVYLKEDGTWNVGVYYITLPNSIVWTAYELPFYVHPDYSSYLMLLREKLAASSSFYLDKMSIWREEFTFTDQKHMASFSNYQARNEIKNRIVIKGEKQADPASREETMPPELKGEAYDQASIDEYGERTLTIDNHLFQTQAAIDAMCASLLAEYKDPSWFTDLEIPFNPVPLELWDKISWKERLSPTLEITQTGVIRDIKLDGFNATYVCEK